MLSVSTHLRFANNIYVARYYDPVVGNFISADTVQANLQGMDPYTYVGDNPETHNDPTGHCWPLCTMLAGAAIGAAIGGGTSLISQAMSGHGVDWSEVGKQAAVGAVSGAISGLAGPEAGLLTHSVVGAAAGAAGQMVSNAIDHKAIMDGVLESAVVGGVTGVVTGAAGKILQNAAGEARASTVTLGNNQTRWSGGDPEVIQGFMQRAQTIRDDLSSSGTIGANRNVGFADYNINGQSGTYNSVSGEASRPGAIDLPANPHYTPSSPGNAQDSEAKMVQNLWNITHGNPNATGSVNLFSEREFCGSCQNMVNAFANDHPNIQIQWDWHTPWPWPRS